jgi:Ca2+-binding EF-hand superfamily protein
MKTMTRIALVSAATLALTPMAYAQSYDQAAAQLEARFKASDRNGDGKLSLQEARDGGMTRVVANFATTDTDGDGFVTLEQLKAQLRARTK